MVYPFASLTLLPFIRFFIRKTKGLENIPKQGPYIIACKHVGSLDGVFIAAEIIPIIKQKIHFVSSVAPWGWVWKKIVAEHWGGIIPFYKEHPQICLDIAQEYLKKGRIVGIFPEGIMEDRQKNKHRAKTGVARMALWSKVPILPIGLKYKNIPKKDMTNMHNRWHVIRNTFIHPHSLEINIGEKFDVSEFYNKEITKDVLYDATNFIMDKIETLIVK